MNIGVDEFWNMTMREFILKQRGYLNALEDEQIHGWNMTRVLACYILKPHLKKGSKLQPKDIMSLPIDKGGEVDVEMKRKIGIYEALRAEKSALKNKKKVVNLESLMIKK